MWRLNLYIALRYIPRLAVDVAGSSSREEMTCSLLTATKGLVAYIPYWWAMVTSVNGMNNFCSLIKHVLHTLTLRIMYTTRKCIGL